MTLRAAGTLIWTGAVGSSNSPASQSAVRWLAAAPGPAYRGPHAGTWTDRAGERGVYPWPEAAPPAVVDVATGLCAGKADAQQLRPADNAVLLIGELPPFDGLRGS